MWSPNELLKTEKQRDILSYITLQFFPFKKVPLEHYPNAKGTSFLSTLMQPILSFPGILRVTHSKPVAPHIPQDIHPQSATHAGYRKFTAPLPRNAGSTACHIAKAA